MRRTGNELRRNSYSRAPNFRLNSTIEFRKGSPTPKLPSVMASHGFPYFFFLPVRCSIIGIYIYIYTIKNVSNLGQNSAPSDYPGRAYFSARRRKGKVGYRDRASPLSEYALTRKANIDIDKVFRSKGIKWESGNPISRRVAFPVRHNYIQLKAQQVTASTR